MKSKADPLRENLSFLKEAEARLKSAGVASARFEAEALVGHYGKMSRIDLFTGKKAVTPAARRSVLAAAARRAKGEPLQHVTGEAHFFGHAFHVSSDVLVPRPETEILAEEALKAAEGLREPKILDLGTGSGCLALSLTIQRPECRMTASDISQKALRVARKNSRRHKLDKKVRFVKSDLFRAFRRSGEKWDVIVTNPPYVPSAEIPTLSREVRKDPRVALDGGRAGLEIVEKILDEAPRFLEKGGTLLMEIGKGQSAVLWKKHPGARFVKDHVGVERVLIFKGVHG